MSGFDPCNSSVELFRPNTADKPPIVIVAHGGFTKELNIGTRDFGRGPIGWSEGGTTQSRNKMLDVINEFIKKL